MTLYIGCGGFGIKTLCHVVRGQGFRKDIACLAIDTEQEPVEFFLGEVRNESARGRFPACEGFVLGKGVKSLEEIVISCVERCRTKEGLERFRKHWWCSPDGMPYFAGRVRVPGDCRFPGAQGSYLLAWHQMARIEDTISQLFGRLLRENGDSARDGFDVCLVASLAGGTGRGIWAIVGFAVRKVAQRYGMMARISGMFAEWTSFTGLSMCCQDFARSLQLNSILGLSELSLWSEMSWGHVDGRYRLPDLQNPEHRQSDCVSDDGTNPLNAAPLSAIRLSMPSDKNVCSRTPEAQCKRTALMLQVEQSWEWKSALVNFEPLSVSRMASCRVDIRGIHRHLEALARRMFVERLVSDDERCDCDDLVRPYANVLSCGSVGMSDLDPESGGLLAKAASAYKMDIRSRVNAFQNVVLKGRKADIRAYVRKASLLSLPEDLAGESLSEALRVSNLRLGPDMADSLVAYAFERGCSIRKTIDVLTAISCMVSERIRFGEPTFDWIRSFGASSVERLRAYLLEEVEEILRPNLSYFIFRRIPEPSVRHLLDLYRNLLLCRAYISVCNALTASLQTVQPLLEKRRAALLELADILMKYSDREHHREERKNVPFVSPRNGAILAALEQGLDEPVDERWIRPIMSENGQREFAEEKSKTDWTAVRRCLLERVLPCVARWEEGTKDKCFSQVVAELVQNVTLPRRVVSDEFTFKSVFHRNIGCLNDLLARNPSGDPQAERMTEALKAYFGASGIFSGEGLARRLDESACLEALVSGMIVACRPNDFLLQADKSGVMMVFLPFGEMVAESIERRIQARMADEGSCHLRVAYEHRGAGGVIMPEGVLVYAFLPLDCKGGAGTFDGVAPLEYWKNGDLQRDLALAEDVRGLAFFEQNRLTGHWGERLRANGFLSPFYIVNAKASAARWKPWMAQLSVRAADDGKAGRHGEPKLAVKPYDVFISYRRSGGIDTARLLCKTLKADYGYRVFFDFDSLRNGEFNKEIFAAIESAKYFILVVSEGAFDRCVEECDWMRMEIEHALKHGKSVIPVSTSCFVFPTGLPPSIASIASVQITELNMRQLFDASVRQLVESRFN